MEVPKSESLDLLESILGLWHMILWFFLGKDLLGLSSVTSSMYIRANAVNRNTMSIDDQESDSTDASLPRNIPDIEIMLIPTNSLERAVPGRNLISIYPTLIQPRGSGCVELQTVNPLDQPRITYPLLSNEHDVKTARLAIRFAMRLGEKLQQSDYPYPATFAFAPGQDATLLVEWENAAPVEQIPSPAVKSVASPMSHSDRIPEGDPDSLQDSEAVKRATSGCQNTWATVTDEEIDDYAKRVSHPGYHFSGTCPMSKDEVSGVVDQQLRVHGFSNLRIADASIFPKIPSCHTMAPVMVVAERCADMVKDTWAGRRLQ
ncbi:Glucose-methanol-choline oxidoreductase [Moelleriella libera RCEF 2490]|uniref:Glucose-methanol-choline oxidoreductase n=1 Tax=Moelleriella libera RCEF 2490 TaxID=1081109 RepID=A0A167W319_9HYPO|nr:Glucose-methanol-choline oxidoreductase [Moelleriella libera RCEF 2490]